MKKHRQLNLGSESQLICSTRGAPATYYYGFSLVELSIVLVILGLLTGGILAGQSLIRAAELRSTLSDTNRYRTAIYSFRDKYLALPGDMNTAGRFWGMANTAGTGGECADPNTNAGTGTQTCNGNGDGYIGPGTAPNERLRAWQHLANAGLIEGSYTGLPGSGGISHVVPGTNAPSGRVSNSGYSLYFWNDGAVDAGTYSRDYGNMMAIGTPTTTSTTKAAFIKAEEMWNMDTKIDDGRPAYGKFISRNATGRPNCATSDTASTAEYALTNTGISSSIYIQLK